MRFIIILLALLLFGCAQKVEKIPADKIMIGPPRGHNFSDEFRQQVHYLQQTFAEVDPTPYEQWMDQFDRDAHPERELEIWLHMAEVYKDLEDQYPKQELYTVIIALSVGSTEIPKDRIPNLTEEDVRVIVERW